MIIKIVNEHGNDTENGNGEVISKLNIRTYNTGVDFGSQLYVCDECEALFRSKTGLWSHRRTKHEGIV